MFKIGQKVVCIDDTPPSSENGSDYWGEVGSYSIYLAKQNEKEGREMITIVVSSANADYFYATIDGKVVCKSRTPFLTAARYLLAHGTHSRSKIRMVHANNLEEISLLSTVGAAAKLTVEEGDKPPRFRPWRAYQVVR
jgi:hypothetical protein